MCAIATELAIILLLVLLNGVFAAAEIAVVSLRKTRLQELAGSKGGSARAVIYLREHPERFLATVQVGITVVGATAAAFGGAEFAVDLAPWIAQVPVLAPHAHGLALALVVASISYLSIVLGELVPKSLALRNAEPYALLIARPILALSVLTRPLVWMLTATSNLVLRPFGDRTTFTETRHSAEEIQQIVEEATRAGTVPGAVGEIASRALGFAGLTARDVMIPRSEMKSIPLSASPEDIQRLVLEEGHSRMPVYREHLDQIVGYIAIRDVLGMIWERHLIVLEDLLRPAYFVPETANAPAVLAEMQRRRVQLGIVVDEHGQVAGLLTSEDLVEELVGELFSEYDVPEEPFTEEGDGSVTVPGFVHIRDVNRRLGLNLEEPQGTTTMAGLAAALAGRIPTKGSKLVGSDGTVLEVVDVSSHVVRRLRVRPPALR